jgi:SAM-dependent methyltransferase
MTDPTLRFSGRVENYVRYRPDYPREILKLLETDCGLSSEAIVGDIGSGTGILAKLFLENGNAVYGVEPNREMRVAGERLLQSFPGFTSIEGTAEATTLPNQTLDFITAGQAFHWFDLDPARQEFKRILRPEGWVVLIWNDRRIESTAFLKGYERLLHTYATDYALVDHKRIDAPVLRQFFGSEPHLRKLPNFQRFDFTSLKGRLLSSSYVPEAGQPKYAPMLAALEKLFEEHEENGIVTFEYDTTMYYGMLP